MRKVFALLVVLTVALVGPTQVVLAGSHGDAGPPEDVETFKETDPIPESQLEQNASDVLYNSTENESLIQVDSEHLDNTTVNISESTVNNSTKLELDINVTTENATNVTFFIQSDAVENQAGNLSALELFLDSENHSWYVDESAGPGNSPWVMFTVPNFSTRTLTFE